MTPAGLLAAVAVPVALATGALLVLPTVRRTGLGIVHPSLAWLALHAVFFGAGAAILAAAGIGLVADERAGIAALVRVAERLAPDPAARAVFDLLAPEYEALHARLAPANTVLGAVEGTLTRPSIGDPVSLP